jgi:hypothetical protein
MNTYNGDINALIDEKIGADTEFQASLEGLEEAEAQQLLADKKMELLNQEFISLAEKAEASKKAQELADNYKVRAEKAEKALKGSAGKSGETSKKTPDYSLQDIRALSDVKDEDVDDIVEYARFKNISISEAKKTTVMQTLLKDREEQRKIAAATATGNSRRGSGKASDESLMENAAKGILPESDEDIARLAAARFAAKKQK